MNIATSIVTSAHQVDFDCDECIDGNQVVDHVRDLVFLPGDEAPGGHPLQPTGDPVLDEAYRVVLTRA